MSVPPDYYRILHVQPDAPLAIVHASYRTLLERARRAGEPRARLALLDEAYAVLGDPERRAAYDSARTGATSRTGTFRLPIVDKIEDTGIRSLGCLFCGTPHGLRRAPDRDDECAQCESPLCAAERHRLEYSGQRMLARVPKLRAVDVRVTWPQAVPLKAEMRDLSLNGMLLAAPAPLELNQIVRIDCTELRALGRVAHVQPDRVASGLWLTGVEFLTLRFRQVRGSFVSAEA